MKQMKGLVRMAAMGIIFSSMSVTGIAEAQIASTTLEEAVLMNKYKAYVRATPASAYKDLARCNRAVGLTMNLAVTRLSRPGMTEAYHSAIRTMNNFGWLMNSVAKFHMIPDGESKQIRDLAEKQITYGPEAEALSEKCSADVAWMNEARTTFRKGTDGWKDVDMRQ